MARKPNYQFERMERQRAKAAKKAAKKDKAENSEGDALAENPTDDTVDLPDADI